MMNHYIYCKKNKINFKINTDKWIYKYKNGWTDYFEDVSLYNNENENDNEIKYANTGDILYDYPILEYKKNIWNLYKYNYTVLEKIKETKNALGLILNNYGSIYIRRGDKLLYESKLYSSEKYIELLLEKYPDCKTVFIQTDDYTSYIEIEKYINEHNLNINLLTLCDKNSKGSIMVDYGGIHTSIVKNKNYINEVKDILSQTKPLVEMSNDEIYNHTISMLIGLNIVFNSKYCILDYQSNVSRFIKLAHFIPENVFDVEGFELDLNKEICPAYPESVYNDLDVWRHT